MAKTAITKGKVEVDKKHWESLEKKASLYEEFLRRASDKIFGVENYSDSRLKEFSKEDKLDKKTESRLQKLFKSL